MTGFADDLSYWSWLPIGLGYWCRYQVIGLGYLLVSDISLGEPHTLYDFLHTYVELTHIKGNTKSLTPDILISFYTYIGVR